MMSSRWLVGISKLAEDDDESSEQADRKRNALESAAVAVFFKFI